MSKKIEIYVMFKDWWKLFQALHFFNDDFEVWKNNEDAKNFVYIDKQYLNLYRI